MARFIGALMILTPFALLFVGMGGDIGFDQAALILGAVIFFVAWVAVAAYLID